MILVDVLLFKDPDPGARKAPNPLDPDPQHCNEFNCPQGYQHKNENHPLFPLFSVYQ